jgi:hypothetical protein
LDFGLNAGHVRRFSFPPPFQISNLNFFVQTIALAVFSSQARELGASAYS